MLLHMIVQFLIFKSDKFRMTQVFSSVSCQQISFQGLTWPKVCVFFSLDKREFLYNAKLPKGLSFYPGPQSFPSFALILPCCEMSTRLNVGVNVSCKRHPCQDWSCYLSNSNLVPFTWKVTLAVMEKLQQHVIGLVQEILKLVTVNTSTKCSFIDRLSFICLFIGFTCQL